MCKNVLVVEIKWMNKSGLGLHIARSIHISLHILGLIVSFSMIKKHPVYIYSINRPVGYRYWPTAWPHDLTVFALHLVWTPVHADSLRCDPTPRRSLQGPGRHNIGKPQVDLHSLILRNN